MFEMADKYDIAWAAGLFEGEGCITTAGCQGRYKVYPNVRIILAMSDRDVVERFQEICNAGNIYLPTDKRRPNAKQIYDWRVQSRQEAKELITAFWPYLGERRRARAKELGLI